MPLGLGPDVNQRAIIVHVDDKPFDDLTGCQGCDRSVHSLLRILLRSNLLLFGASGLGRGLRHRFLGALF